MFTNFSLDNPQSSSFALEVSDDSKMVTPGPFGSLLLWEKDNLVHPKVDRI